MVSVEHGMITTKGLPNSRRRARTRGSSLKGGLVTTHSPRSCVEEVDVLVDDIEPELGQVVAGRAVAVEGFPEGEVAWDVGAHVLPRGEGGHVVVVFYHKIKAHYFARFLLAICAPLEDR